MKKFNHWVNESFVYNQQIDGPPLKTHTIAAAEVQIRQLALELRTSFGLDKRFEQYHDQIFKAAELLEKAVSTLESVRARGIDRNTPHKYHQP